MLTSGRIKSNIPRFPITPPGLAATSLSSCAAFAIDNTFPAILLRSTPAGPPPIIHLLVLPPKSASGISQSLKICAAPNKSSALERNKSSIPLPPAKPGGNIFETPPITSASSVLIPPITSLNNAPIN